MPKPPPPPHSRYDDPKDDPLRDEQRAINRLYADLVDLHDRYEKTLRLYVVNRAALVRLREGL